jgi:hypothetical protein
MEAVMVVLVLQLDLVLVVVAAVLAAILVMVEMLDHQVLAQTALAAGVVEEEHILHRLDLVVMVVVQMCMVKD